MYGIIIEILSPGPLFTAALCTNCFGVVNCWYLMCAVVFVGSRLSAEASRTAIVYDKSQGCVTSCDAHKLNFVYVMTQVKARNISVQNFLFKIDWTVVLGVGFESKLKIKN